MERGISSMGFHRRSGTRNNELSVAFSRPKGVTSLQRTRKDHRHYRVLEVWGSSGCVAPKKAVFLTFSGSEKVKL